MGAHFNHNTPQSFSEAQWLRPRKAVSNLTLYNLFSEEFAWSSFTLLSLFLNVSEPQDVRFHVITI